MDALSHALVMVIIFHAAGGAPPLLPFAIVGAVIVDADIVFGLFSGRSPALYMFTHGGFAHSITGSVVMSGLAIAGMQLAVLAGVLPARAAGISLILSFSVVLAGALIHLGIDALAYPGIPLLYPLSDRKMTAGILPGPSILLFITTGSIAVSWFAGWVAASTAVWTAAAVLVLYLGLRAGVLLVVRSRQLRGRCVPTANPLQWIIIDEDTTSVSVARYLLMRGISGQAKFRKYTNTDSTGTEPFLSLPEVRRLKFHSYVMVAEKTGSEFIFSDPLRENGYFRYPPDYRRLVIPIAPDKPGMNP